MKKIAYALTLSTIALSFWACTKQLEDVVANRTLDKNALAVDYTDIIDRVNFSGWQQTNTTNARISLGRVLFYDTKLSFNNTTSCGSCHKQSLAFSDNTPFSAGFKGVNSLRNSKPIQNILPNGQPLFWDGRADSLGQLITMPVRDHIEMGFEKIENLPAKLNREAYYPELFEQAFGTSDITIQRITVAMRDFITMLNSASSKLEMAQSGGNIGGGPFFTAGFNIWNSEVPGLSTEENDGLDLFINKAGCANCHNGRELEGWDNANTGLDMNYADQGIGKMQPGMDGVFRIPGLRNIELTAPYMHDGRFNTLEEVIDFYDHGVVKHENLDWRMRDIPGGATSPFVAPVFNPNQEDLSEFEPKRLNLTAYEKKALVSFLKTLTDRTFTTDPRLSNPFRASN